MYAFLIRSTSFKYSHSHRIYDTNDNNTGQCAFAETRRASIMKDPWPFLYCIQSPQNKFQSRVSHKTPRSQ